MGEGANPLQEDYANRTIEVSENWFGLADGKNGNGKYDIPLQDARDCARAFDGFGQGSYYDPSEFDNWMDWIPEIDLLKLVGTLLAVLFVGAVFLMLVYLGVFSELHEALFGF